MIRCFSPEGDLLHEVQRPSKDEERFKARWSKGRVATFVCSCKEIKDGMLKNYQWTEDWYDGKLINGGKNNGRFV